MSISNSYPTREAPTHGVGRVGIVSTPFGLKVFFFCDGMKYPDLMGITLGQAKRIIRAYRNDNLLLIKGTLKREFQQEGE